MKLTINLDERLEGPSLEERVKALLKERNLPECIGNMCPPITSSIVEIDADTIIKHKKALPEENIAASLRGDAFLSDMVIDVNGAEYLKSLKESHAQIYVNRVVKCTTCQHYILCNMLTTHYINTIKE